MRSFLCLLLGLLLGLPPAPPLAAQQATSAPPPSALNIVVIQGEGAVNRIRRRVTREPIVQVESANRRPITAAAVTFTLPESGPGGVFPSNLRTLVVRTDGAGRAIARGIRANDIQGKFQIRVQASFRGRTATSVINQVNTDVTAGARKGGKTKLVVIAAAVGAAVAAGVVVNNRNKNADAASISISAGTPAVGGPQ